LPLISVLLPVYNDAPHVRASIESILTQTLGDFELVVINDGSTDDTPELLNQYQDPRIRLIHNERNLGLSPSLNRAIAAARGEYLARQDADDIALPHRLEKQVVFLRSHPDIAMVGSRAIVIDEQGLEQGILDDPPIADIDIKWRLLFRNPFIHSSVMMCRDVVDKTGGYTEDPFRAFVEDYDLWSRINRVARSANILEPLEKYRVNPGGVSARTHSEQQRQAEEISKRNICWLLGWTEMDLCAWYALKQFSLNFSLNWAPLTADEVSRALALNEAIHETFASRYLTRDLAGQHRRRYYLPWARRTFAQARRNPHLDYRCRGVMLGAAAKFLLNTWRPGLLSFSNYSEINSTGSVREQKGPV
jgi:hypothetical protein